MALEEDEQQQQQQTKRIKALHSSQPSEDPQFPPPLPPEIIFDILTRLPVKSLLRLRSVCKLWCSIVSDPRFIKSHLTFSTANINRRFIFPTKARLSIKSCPLYDMLQDGSVNKSFQLDYPLKHPSEAVLIFGSCNGLLLIANKDEGKDDVLFIWNPSTRKSKRLPWIVNKRGPGMYRVFAFGYEESTNDYKVFAIRCAPNITVKIYSLKTGNWKTVGHFHDCFPWDEYSIIYMNGAFHWMINPDRGSSDSWRIVCVDLATESYGEIVQPVYDEFHTALTLGDFGGWLCVLCDYIRDHADVWVMKVYGVEDSWTKLFSIPYLTDPGRDRFLVPLCISNEGKVLLQVGSKLVTYDSRNCSFSDIQNFGECLGYKAYTFAESLVSPDSLAGAGDNNEA